jgi:hypothetical protein
MFYRAPPTKTVPDETDATVSYSPIEEILRQRVPGGFVLREPVESRSIASIGYDPGAQTLEVEFKRGGVYRYLRVPEQVWRELTRAESHGQYLNAQVKGHFTAVKVG